MPRCRLHSENASLSTTLTRERPRHGNTAFRAVRILRCVVCVIVTFAAADPRINVARAQNSTPIDIRREYNVKAVNVYGFCRFVTWPQDAFDQEKSDLIVGIYGESPIESALKTIAQKKTVNNRRLQVVLCKSEADVAKCHVAFVSGSVDSEEQFRVIRETIGRPVVLIGEYTGFGRAGGIANFYINEGRVRFELNNNAARARGLKLDAKLLSLGTEIKKSP